MWQKIKHGCDFAPAILCAYMQLYWSLYNTLRCDTAGGLSFLSVYVTCSGQNSTTLQKFIHGHGVY
jgi:hypothetical protein